MTVSGWLAQLYPFLQKWNYKRRYILLTCRRHIKYVFKSIRRSRQNGAEPSYMPKSPIRNCCYMRQSYMTNEKVPSGPEPIVTSESLPESYTPLDSENGNNAKSRLLAGFGRTDSGYDELSSISIDARNSLGQSAPTNTNTTAAASMECMPTGATTTNTVASRRMAYWSNYSSMSTSSDDISLISSSTNSTNASVASTSASLLRRMSLCNSSHTSNLAKYSYKV